MNSIVQPLQLQQPFNGLFSRTTWVSRYQKGKTNLDFTGARDSEWQWHQLSYMQVCTSLQTDNHASTPPLSFLQAGCPSCRPTNSVKALKALTRISIQTTGLAFGGTGLCSYSVRGVDGSCAKHLTVVIICQQKYLLLSVFHHPLTFSLQA